MERIERIKSVELFIVELPLIRPFETSFSVQKLREALLVKVVSGDVCGWGECVAGRDPFYAYETNATAIHIIKDYLAPMLLNLKGFSVAEAVKEFNRVRGHNMAKAALENSLLDLAARREGIPLYELIGGKKRRIMSGISIGIKDDINELLQLIEGAVTKGYHRIKIKIKKGKDISILKQVREAFPDIRLMADANADYSVQDIDRLKQMDAFNLMMIEQPLGYDDIYFHSLVQKKINTPVCLDESIKMLNDAKIAYNLGSCRIINIKQGRVAGILAANKIQSFCKANGISCWSGGMLETGIGRAFNIHLQTLPGFDLPGDTSETSRYFHEDIVDKPVVLEPDGFIEIPEGCGIGVEVLVERLEKYKTFYEKMGL